LAGQVFPVCGRGGLPRLPKEGRLALGLWGGRGLRQGLLPFLPLLRRGGGGERSYRSACILPEIVPQLTGGFPEGRDRRDGRQIIVSCGRGRARRVAA